MQSYFIIGDIHGEIGLLNRLLEQVESYSPEQLIFIGDYIDRGPYPRKVIDRVIELGDRAVGLMGNHELMMLDAVEQKGYGASAVELWYYNGAESTLQSFGSNSFFSFKSDLNGRYLDFFRGLKMNHLITFGNTVKFLVTHAGVSPSIPISDQLEIHHYLDHEAYLQKNYLVPAESFLWVRDHFFNAPPELFEDHIIVHGHTPVNKLKRLLPSGNSYSWECLEGDLCIRTVTETGQILSIDIDSGSTISGRLSALGILVVDGSYRLRSITVSTDEVIERDLVEKKYS